MRKVNKLAFEAIKNGDIQQLEALHQAGYDFRKKLWGNSPIHLVALYTRDEKQAVSILEFLVDKGVDINEIAPNGETALHFFVRRGSDPLIKRALELGADPAIPNKEGETPFVCYIREITEARLEEEEKGKISPEIVRLFIEKGANPNAKTKSGVPVANLLLSNFYFSKDRKATLEAATVLFEAGALPLGEKQTNPPQQTAFELALRALEEAVRPERFPSLKDDFENLLKVMIKAGADVNAHLPGGYPIERVLGNKDALDVLLRLGANPNILTHRGKTPMHVVAEWGNLDNLLLLHRAGGRFDAKDAEGETPLSYFFQTRGRYITLEALENLSELGIDLKRFRTARGESLMHVVAKSFAFSSFSPSLELVENAKNVFEFLVKKIGLDPNEKDQLGNTPLHYLIISNEQRLVEKIISLGGKPWLTNQKGASPGDIFLNKLRNEKSTFVPPWVVYLGLYPVKDPEGFAKLVEMKWDSEFLFPEEKRKKREEKLYEFLTGLLKEEPLAGMSLIPALLAHTNNSHLSKAVGSILDEFKNRLIMPPDL